MAVFQLDGNAQRRRKLTGKFIIVRVEVYYFFSLTRNANVSAWPYRHYASVYKRRWKYLVLSFTFVPTLVSFGVDDLTFESGHLKGRGNPRLAPPLRSGHVCAVTSFPRTRLPVIPLKANWPAVSTAIGKFYNTDVRGLVRNYTTFFHFFSRTRSETIRHG